MKTQLVCSVDVSRVLMFATLASWERRPELQRLCALGGDTGTIDPRRAAESLPGLSDTACRNLLRHLAYLELIDRHGALTDLGRRCAETGEAPTWELGAFDMLVAVHPLFGRRVLGVNRREARAGDRSFEVVEAPSWLRPDAAQVDACALGSFARVSLVGFPAPRGMGTRCFVEAADPATLVWDLDLATGENRWSLRGEVRADDGPRAYETAPESVEPAQVAGLYAAWERRLDGRTGRVGIDWDGALQASGRETFLRTLHYPRVQVGALGTFEDVHVEDVPVGPRNATAARAWALGLTAAAVAAEDAYCPPTRVSEAFGSVVHGTPLAPQAGGVPVYAELAATTMPHRTRWQLAAALDLSLE